MYGKMNGSNGFGQDRGNPSDLKIWASADCCSDPAAGRRCLFVKLRGWRGLNGFVTSRGRLHARPSSDVTGRTDGIDDRSEDGDDARGCL